MLKKMILWILITMFAQKLLADIRHTRLQQAGYQYLSPLPNSEHVSQKSKIILRFKSRSPANLLNLQNFIVVKGHGDNQYPGKTKLAADRKTIIFSPNKNFTSGEKITVILIPKFPENAEVLDFEYSFYVSKSEFAKPVVFPDERKKEQVQLSKSTAENKSSRARILSNGVSVPSNFPEIDVSINKNPDDGLIFINYRRYPCYQLILDNNGEPVWYWQVPDDRRDFKAQSNGQLTMMIRDGYGGSGDGYIVLDQHYEYVKTIRATNGYWTDEHELLMLPDSGYFLIGRREEKVDMSAYGKPENATVRETCIQEYTKDDELIFQWAAWDYFDPADLDYDVNGNDHYIRFPHMNAIHIDDDDHILLSSRHLNEVTKINRQTGEIIWRLSGKNNEFEFINDDLQGFRSQHAVRALGNNHYTVFDNGNSHNPPQSRAVEYELDIDHSTATLVWEYRNDKPQYHSYYMGNAQRLPNGNTLINWAIGPLPKLSEITPEGKKAYEMTFADGTHVYRTFKMGWQGERKTPYLIAESYSTHVNLIFNKFGDPDVDYYKIYGEQSPEPETLIDTSQVTLKKLSDLENGTYYFRVTAVNSNGGESDFSNQEKVNINFVEPGENLVKNGDFSSGGDHWIWEVTGEATASWEILNGESHISIGNSGSQIYNVQLRQNGIPLLKGKDYIFEFDAYAENDRVVEIKVSQDSSPWINYSKIGYTALSKQLEHYRYIFTMEDATDVNARVVINCGADNEDVYIDNISVKENLDTDVKKRKHRAADFQLLGNFPNPFNNRTTIRYYLGRRSRINIYVYDLTGKRIMNLIDKEQDRGHRSVDFDAAGLSSGIYFYTLEFQSADASSEIRQMKKMILCK